MIDPHLLTRCVATTRKGERCKHWAAIGTTYCWQHGGVATGKRKPCTCIAYPFPHKPGGGLCCYPDAPIYRWVDNRKDRHRYSRSDRRQMAKWRALCRNEGR